MLSWLATHDLSSFTWTDVWGGRPTLRTTETSRRCISRVSPWSALEERAGDTWDFCVFLYVLSLSRSLIPPSLPSFLFVSFWWTIETPLSFPTSSTTPAGELRAARVLMASPGNTREVGGYSAVGLSRGATLREGTRNPASGLVPAERGRGRDKMHDHPSPTPGDSI